MANQPRRAEFPNIRHMHLLCEALDLGSVSLAAERLNITQPAASQGIAGLERYMGATLMLRQTTGIAATEAGATFSRRARRALAELKAGSLAAQKAVGVDRRNQSDLTRRFTAAQLRALIAVGDEGSFTVAANELGVSQPTVHRAARDIETACGFDIFRTTRGKVELTTAGASLLQAAKLARSEMRAAREEIDALRGGGKSSFVLGALPLARSEIVPVAIEKIQREDPGIQVQVVEGRYLDLLRRLREGDLDCLVGALRQPPPASDVIEEVLFHDELAVVCGANHPLIGLTPLSFDNTSGYPWIAPPITAPAGRFLARIFGADGQNPSPVRVVSSSLVLVKGLLARGDYLTIISRHQIDREVRSGDIIVLPIDLSEHTRAIGLTTRRSWHPTAAQEAFRDRLRRAAVEAAEEIRASISR